MLTLLSSYYWLWQYVQEDSGLALTADICDGFAELSLAACAFTAKSRTEQILSMLDKYLSFQVPDYLRMAIANRKSISLRLKGDHDQSDVVIQEALEGVTLNSTNIRSHCYYGRLLLSQTENAILRKEFGKAASYLTSWDVKTPSPSGLELQLVRLKNTVLGRVLRYKGNFEDARYCLEECLKTVPGDTSRYHIMHHLADVYCELGCPGDAQELVLNEVNRLRNSDNQKAFRRLLLPLSEAYLEQRMLEVARNTLQELLDIYETKVDPDVADQLGHVRSMIALARVDWYDAHSLEACQSLEKALALTGKYMTFSDGNFYIGVIHLFLSVLYSDTCRERDRQTALAAANDILCKQEPRHFMPGMGTYFFKSLKKA